MRLARNRSDDDDIKQLRIGPERLVHRVEIGEVDGVGGEQKTPGANARGNGSRHADTESREVAVEMSMNAK